MTDLYDEVDAAITAEIEVERIMDNVDKDARQIQALGKPKQRKPSSKDAQHFDPLQGRRFVDDVSGWLIGASIVALIAAAVIAAHTYDYWGL